MYRNLIALVVACTFAAVAPAPARAQATSTLDVTFAADAGDLGKLDIYAPAAAHNAPVLVFFHGGGRETGSRKDIAKLGKELSAEGILVVSPSYRLRTPATMNVDFRVQAADAARAIAWVEKNVAHYGGNSKGIVLSGVSAGAGLVGLIATDTHYLSDAGVDPKHVAAAYIMSGVLDNRAVPADYANPQMWYHDFGPTEADRWDVSPLKYVGPGTMPILVSTGSGESARFVATGQAFVARMRAVGAPVVAYSVVGADHSSEWGLMLTPGSAPHRELVKYVLAHAGTNR